MFNLNIRFMFKLTFFLQIEDDFSKMFLSKSNNFINKYFNFEQNFIQFFRKISNLSAKDKLLLGVPET